MDPEPGSRRQRLTRWQDTWSARCGESRTPGAAGGPGKPPGAILAGRPGPTRQLATTLPIVDHVLDHSDRHGLGGVQLLAGRGPSG